MAIDPVPATPAPKTRRVVTLLSGTSWTPPAGCLYVNATLFAGGGSGALQSGGTQLGSPGFPGEVVATTVATTPGTPISYTIGAGGPAPASSPSAGNPGGNTTFTGATTAHGGPGGPLDSTAGVAALMSTQNNGGGVVRGFSPAANAGGPGKIELEYWV